MRIVPGQVKHAVLEALMAFIYKQVNERRDKTLETIISRNDTANNMQRLVFNYAGQRWTRHRFKGVPQGVPYLDDQLHTDMDAYIEEGRMLNEREQPMVLAYLRAILNSDADVAVALVRIPTAMHGPIREAITAAEEECKQKADLDFDQVEKLVGAYPAATQAIRQRMMLNMLVE